MKLRCVLIVGALILLLLMIFLTSLILKPEWYPIFPLLQNKVVTISAVLASWATFLLALAAFWAIMDTRYGRNLDKKERLLNEIIEWAISVANCSIGGNSKDILEAELDTTGKADQVYTTMQLDKWSIRLQSILKIGKYIISPSSKIFTDDLKISINALNDDLDKFIESLGECSDIKLHRLLSSAKDREGYNKAMQLHTVLENSAQRVIEEAIKIKNKDIT